ncbi:MAG: hypothetical protein IJ094_01140 [Bacilli bacterium]|nr:hypothetical protein [Bacilli bacterium]
MIRKLTKSENKIEEIKKEIDFNKSVIHDYEARINKATSKIERSNLMGSIPYYKQRIEELESKLNKK